MPPGAKKRKAAKKKKEQETNNNNNTSTSINDSSQGHDDPKSQDERESDVGEVNSPTSQGHSEDQEPFNEWNKGSEIMDPSPMESYNPEKKPEEGSVTVDSEENQKIELDDGFVVEVRELKSEEDTGKGAMNVEHLNSAKESHEDSSSSSSSSDDDSRALEKQIEEAAPNDSVVNKTLSEEVVDIDKDEKPSDSEAIIPILETSAAAESDTPVVPASEAASVVLESAQVVNPEALEVVESELTETVVEVLPGTKATEVNEESKAILNKEKTEDRLLPLLAAENGVDENGVVTSTTSGPVIGESSDDPRENKVSEASDTSVNGKEGKVSAPPGAHATEGGHDAQNPKISEFSENQPVAASVIGVAQRASWMSCCGLFDIFSR